VVLLSIKVTPLLLIAEPSTIPKGNNMTTSVELNGYITNDMKMYGCNIETFKESVKRSITYRLSGGSMVVAGLMSDAQEMMAHGDIESARMYLNRAKALVFDMRYGDMAFGPKEKA